MWVHVKNEAFGSPVQDGVTVTVRLTKEYSRKCVNRALPIRDGHRPCRVVSTPSFHAVTVVLGLSLA